jgi:tetratricopeptide (TPR) repeat protein
MKKVTILLWAIIISCTAFVGYTYINRTNVSKEIISANPQITEEKVQIPENETYSSLLKKANILLENEYYKEAIETYKQALNVDPESKEALYKIGLAYLKDNKPEESRRYLLQLQEIEDNIEIQVLIGKTYLGERKIQTAKSYFDSLKKEELNDEAKYYIAVLKILYKKHDEAKTELTALLPTVPKVQTILDAYNTFALNKEGKEEFLETLLAKALADIDEAEEGIPLLYDAIKLQNDYRDAWIILGYCYLNVGKTDDAIAALNQARILEEKKPETLFLLGIANTLNEKYEDAEKFFNEALDTGFEPKSEINQRLADLSLLKEDYEKALQSYLKIIESGAADTNIFTKAVWICIEKLKKPARALGIAETAVKNFPEKAESYNLLGWAFTAHGDYKKAGENLVKAINIDSTYASAYLNLGWMYEKQNLLSTAKEYYKKAYLNGGQNPIANMAAARFNNINKYMQANITK